MESPSHGSHTGRTERRKRTYSTSSGKPHDNATSIHRPGDSLENGILLPDTSPLPPAKRARTETHPQQLNSKAVMLDTPTSGPVEDNLQADMETQRSLELLKSFRNDLLGIRSTVTCKICTRLFFEPYTTPCGHTYCYSCLDTWFTSSRGRKSCPDCRAAITRPPAPAYAIKDIVAVFLNRPELFPPNETADSLQQLQMEEASLVQADKDNKDPQRGGLFKGCFKIGLPRLMPIRDAADGIDRCPRCHWEIEDGTCEHCGHGFIDEDDEIRTFSDMDEYTIGAESESDAFRDVDEVGDWFDLDDPDMDDVFAHAYATQQMRRHRQARPARVSGQNLDALLEQFRGPHRGISPEGEHSDDDDDGSLTSGFIDDDSELSSEQITPRTHAADAPLDADRGPRTQPSRRHRRIIESESPSEASDSAHEDEDNNPADDEVSFRSLGQRSVTPASISQFSAASWHDQDDLSDEGDEGDVEYGDYDARAAIMNGGWSPLAHSGFDDDEVPGEPTYDDSDDESTSLGLAP